MKHGTATYDEVPAATRVLYGSASVLSLLIGAHAVTHGVGAVGEAWTDLSATLAPDLLMGAVVVGLILAGAAIRLVGERRRLTARPTSSRSPA